VRRKLGTRTLPGQGAMSDAKGQGEQEKEKESQRDRLSSEGWNRADMKGEMGKETRSARTWGQSRYCQGLKLDRAAATVREE